MILGAVIMTGCSVAKGRDLAPRDEIFRTLNAEGFSFDRTLISTVYGESQKQVIVTGPMVLRVPDKNSELVHGMKVSQYSKIVVEDVNGKWKITSATKVER